MKPGPGSLHHLAQALGLGTKSYGTIGQQSADLRPAFGVASALLGLDGLAWAKV